MAGYYPDLDGIAADPNAPTGPLPPRLNPLQAINAVVRPNSTSAQSYNADSPSANAAKDAAAKTASDGGYVGGHEYSAQAPALRAGMADDAATKNWNAMVAQIGGIDPRAATAMAGVNAGTGALPSWNKAAGEAAINQTGGAPRMLNVGYGSTVVGMGSGSRGQANSFVGAGGGNENASPLDTMRDQLATLNARQKMYSESGTMSGRLRAVALSKQAQRLSQQIYTEGMTQHAMGTLNLETQKAYPDIAFGKAAINSINEGDTLGALRILAAKHGANFDATQFHPLPMGGIGMNPNDPNGGSAVYDFQGRLTGHNTPGGFMPVLTPLPNRQ